MKRSTAKIDESITSLFFVKDSILYWGQDRNYNATKGSVAGCVNGQGRLQTIIKSRHYQNHRILFYIYHGYLPKFVDHIDGNPLNNSIENLRAASRAQNNHNAKLRKDNRLGIKGVSWDRSVNKYRARVRYKGRSHLAGLFKCKECARSAVERLRLNLHKEFSNDGCYATEEAAAKCCKVRHGVKE